MLSRQINRVQSYIFFLEYQSPGVSIEAKEWHKQSNEIGMIAMINI